MVSSPRLGPITPGTAPDVATTRGRAARALPSDILQQASRRLSITAMLMALLYGAGWPLGRAAIREVFKGTAPPLSAS